jgi:hypothetical protein
MARGYSCPWQKAAGREDSFRYAQRRRNYSSLNDQCLAEKAIRAKKVPVFSSISVRAIRTFLFRKTLNASFKFSMMRL